MVVCSVLLPQFHYCVTRHLQTLDSTSSIFSGILDNIFKCDSSHCLVKVYVSAGFLVL